MTPIGSRLFVSLNDEYLRMQNDWFFKWHHISRQRAVEIDSFRGKPIVYGGIKFSGSARLVYWDTIQHYLRNKIGSIFDGLEVDLTRYPLEIRAEALNEARWIVGQFAEKIRKTAIEKDRILRGDGIKFPPEDSGHWRGWHAGDIEGRVDGLRRIYCDMKQDVGGVEVSLGSLRQDKVTLVKKDGTVFRADIPATVSTGEIITFIRDLPIEVGDHFLRQLPNGLVDDYIVTDPGYRSGVAGGVIQPHFQVKVRRSDAPAAPPQTIIANFHGPNSRMNVNSTDSSSNTVIYQTHDLAQLADEFFRLREALLIRAQSAEHYAAIGVIASAELEAKSGEQPKLSALGAAGRWVLDTAKDIGAQIATEVVKAQLGL